MSATPHRPGSHGHGQSPAREPGQAWRFAAAGLCASLVGLGLARFAYTPLIPALIAAEWFSPSDVIYLGAANLAGYLAGALAARPLAARTGSVRALRGTMVLATLSCLACAMPVAFAWFFAWRFLAGLSGGVIMVLAASAILPHTAAGKRGLVGGVIFAGVGLGIAASGTLVPLLLQQGLRESWLGLAALSGVLTLVAWPNWPKGDPAAASHSGAVATRPRLSAAVPALTLQYGLNAVALVPHMVFVVDFIACGLGQGIAAGSQYWVLYGLGAVVGPLLTGHLADRAGFRPALRAAFLIQAVAAALPAVSTAPAVLIVSCLVIGGFTPGIVPLVLGRIHELIPHGAKAQRAAWGRATTMFALFQAGAAYGLAALFDRTGGDYRILFVVGSAAAALALAIDLVLALTVRARPSGASS